MEKVKEHDTPIDQTEGKYKAEIKLVHVEK